MIGQFAYIVVAGGRVTQVSSFWFGDDPLANPLSSLYSASGGESGTTLAPESLTGLAAWGTGLTEAAQSQVSVPTLPAVVLTPAPQDLQQEQQQESTHQGALATQAAHLNESLFTPQSQGQPSEGTDQQQPQQPQDQQSNLPASGTQPQQKQGGQAVSPSGAQGQPNQPVQGNDQKDHLIVPKGRLAGLKTDERLSAETEEGFMAFGVAAVSSAGKEARLNREGFAKLKEEQRRRRFLPWFGGEVGKREGRKTGLRE